MFGEFKGTESVISSDPPYTETGIVVFLHAYKCLILIIPINIHSGEMRESFFKFRNVDILFIVASPSLRRESHLKLHIQLF